MVEPKTPVALAPDDQDGKFYGFLNRSLDERPAAFACTLGVLVGILVGVLYIIPEKSPFHSSTDKTAPAQNNPAASQTPPAPVQAFTAAYTLPVSAAANALCLRDRSTTDAPPLLTNAPLRPFKIPYSGVTFNLGPADDLRM